MDLRTFFSKIKNSISSVLKKETAQRSIRSQRTTWIRFMKGSEYVNLAFNSRMTPVYMLNDINSSKNDKPYGLASREPSS